MNIGERIKRAREAAGLSLYELAKAVHKSHEAVRRWEHGTHEPRPHHLRLAAQKLGVTEAHLRGWNVEAPAKAAGRRLPHISWVQAGEWAEAMDPFESGDADSWLPSPVPTGPRAFILTVLGDSMTSPYGRSYPNGTLIYVDPDVPPQTGKRVIARHSESGDVTFKELAADAGRYYLKPLNPQYETLRTDGGWEVIGTVVASLQPE